MKFRDPKTEEVFEDIQNARIAFCMGRMCSENCPFGCAATVERNPAEAARRMGYEVVEDREEPMEKTDRPHPDHILRKPRFTEEEVAQAEEIRHVFGREDVIKRTDEGALRYGYIFLNSALLPSLRPGQAVILKEIIHATDR